MSWCGYIDMLGTRKMASRDRQELVDNLDRFHSALADNFSYLSTGRCIAFSDGAFFETEKFRDFYPYYLRVRNHLFQKLRIF